MYGKHHTYGKLDSIIDMNLITHLYPHFYDDNHLSVLGKLLKPMENLIKNNIEWHILK